VVDRMVGQVGFGVVEVMVRMIGVVVVVEAMVLGVLLWIL